jgi:phenylalanyl-tRNA synthetase alpha chain
VTVSNPDSLLSQEEVSAAIGGLAPLSDEREVDAWRTRHLGRKSRLMLSLRALGRLDRTERAAVGRLLNDAKTRLGEALSAKQTELKARRTRDLPSLDVSLPGRPLPAGGLHPITRTERAIVAAFATMGFHVIEGPEVELEYYNFEALRIPADHPARDAMDTFYLDGPTGGAPLLLRTHTSPNQIRFMEHHDPPIRLIAPGRTYRNEATDATHEWMITQTEVLAVDRGLTLAHLKGALYEFARHLFGEDREIRFRCDYFPFVEPGVEVSISSPDGWIEILGAGMVHPEILANMGYDPEVYTGFAAGLGVERIAMLRHGIRDIRRFYENDLRFLAQF